MVVKVKSICHIILTNKFEDPFLQHLQPLQLLQPTSPIISKARIQGHSSIHKNGGAGYIVCFV